MYVMEYNVIIEKDEDGWFVATVPEIPGCYTQGKTYQQVIERVAEAIEVCLEADGMKNNKPLKFVGIQRVEVATN